MPSGPAPSLDALVVKLLEVSHAKNPNIPQVKNLVAQLPAAAAEVRGLQAGGQRTGPCSCGLDQEVARLQEQLQTYIDMEPDTKKGKGRKTMAMENQRLTKVVTDQKKDMNGYLTTIRKQSAEVEKLRKELRAKEGAQARIEQLKKTQPAPSVGTSQPSATSAGNQVAQQSKAVKAETRSEQVSNGNQQAAMFALQKQAPPLTVGLSDPTNARDPRLDARRFATPIPRLNNDGRQPSFARTTVPETMPSNSASTPVVKLPSYPNVAYQAWKLRVSRGLPAGSQDLATAPSYLASEHNFGKPTSKEMVPGSAFKTPLVSLPGASKKRPAAEDLNSGAPKRARADSGYAVQSGVATVRKPVCEGCRSAGTHCDHRSRCAECDLRISPCIHVLCNDLEGCTDPSCDYLHDDQWDSKTSPVWLIKGVNTFSDDPVRESFELSKALKVFCASEDGECDYEDDRGAEEGCETTVLDYDEAS